MTIAKLVALRILSEGLWEKNNVCGCARWRNLAYFIAQQTRASLDKMQIEVGS